jgi:hypothetical protein
MATMASQFHSQSHSDSFNMVTPPLTLEEQIDILDIFIESAEELKQSWFLEEITEAGVGANMRWSHGGLIECERKGPEHEAVKSILLTIRFFCQSRTERASIENVDNIVQSLSVEQSLKDKFKTSRENFKEYLDAPPLGITFPEDSKAATRWDIFDTFLYGRFAHANPKKREIVKKWETELYYHHLRVQFDLIVLEFIKATAAMANICREVRAQIVK